MSSSSMLSKNRHMTMEFPNPHCSTFISSLDLAELSTIYGTPTTVAEPTTPSTFSSSSNPYLRRESVYRPGGHRDSFVDWRNPFSSTAIENSHQHNNNNNNNNISDAFDPSRRYSFLRTPNGGMSSRKSSSIASSSNGRRISAARNSFFHSNVRPSHKRRGSSITSETLTESKHEDQQDNSFPPMPTKSATIGMLTRNLNNIDQHSEITYPDISELQMPSISKMNRQSRLVSAYLDAPDFPVIPSSIGGSRKSIAWAVQAPHPSVARKSIVAASPKETATFNNSYRLSRAHSQLFDQFIALWDNPDQDAEDDDIEEDEDDQEEASDEEDGIEIPSMGYSHPEELLNPIKPQSTPANNDSQTTITMPQIEVPKEKRKLLPSLNLDLSFRKSPMPSPSPISAPTRSISPFIISPTPKRKPEPLQFSLNDSRPVSENAFDWMQQSEQKSFGSNTPALTSAASSGSSIKLGSENSSPTSIYKNQKTGHNSSRNTLLPSPVSKGRFSKRLTKILSRMWTPKQQLDQSAVTIVEPSV